MDCESEEPLHSFQSSKPVRPLRRSGLRAGTFFSAEPALTHTPSASSMSPSLMTPPEPDNDTRTGNAAGDGATACLGRDISDIGFRKALVLLALLGLIVR